MNEKLHLMHSLEHMKGMLETERKFVGRDPELFEQYRPFAEKAITQAYLSNPSDEYSLRLRETVTDDATLYSATLKDRGEMTEDGLRRLEVEVPLSQSTYEYYLHSCDSVVRKLRAEPAQGITIDWIEGLDTPVIEVENPGINEKASLILSTLQGEMTEVTGDTSFDNEALAYSLNNLEYAPAPTLDVATIMGDVEAFRKTGKQNIVITLAGRSGSGKTTLARELAQALADTYGGSPIMVSTDDYHFGKTYLEETYKQPWQNWDLSEVYNTKELARDIERLHRHEPVQSRSFDFASQEPVKGARHIFSPFVIVEGIHGGSRDLANVRDIHFEIPTTLATSLGRDIGRLLENSRPNDSIGTPSDRLKYMLETGEPTYRAFERPRRNAFSASVRPLGSIALKH